MFKRRLKSLPVLLYHYVRAVPGPMSRSVTIFEEQCRLLAENGIRGIGLAEAEAFLAHGEELPSGSVLITFDDGYLDNYVYAWPILQKYGHKATIFAVTDRLTAAGSGVRPTLAEVWAGNRTEEELPDVSGESPDEFGHTIRRDPYITWEEARLMEQSGVIDIAGHSLGHNSVLVGPEYSGFMVPGRQGCNYARCIKPSFYWGMPNHKRIPELSGPAYLPHPDLEAAVKKLVPQEGSAVLEFFADAGKVDALSKLVASLPQGRMETRDEQAARYAALMAENQSIFRRELGDASRSLCWPWGKFCQEALQAGQDAGFEVFYTTKYGVNPAGKPLAVNRFKAKHDRISSLPGRVRLYSRPWLGALYTKIRM